MTEIEAKEYMENEIRCVQMASYCDRNCAKCVLVKEEQPLLEAFGEAVKSLEEIQQYRAIGTVKDFKLLQTFKELYDAYNLIGTINEFRNLKMKDINKNRFEKEIKTKIIDEMEEKLLTDVESFPAEVNGVNVDLLTLDYFMEFVSKIAKEMRNDNTVN